MRWDQGLDEPFLSIAGTTANPLRVVAGPGTGKTFALIRRVTRLLEVGASARRILVCTLTRTAAADLAATISELGVPGADRIWAGTLHAFCFRLLGRAEALAVTGRAPRPLLDFEERFMLEDLMREGLGGIRLCRKRLSAFNAAWARLQSDEPGWPDEPDDRSFHVALLAWLHFHQCMLIGELVPEAMHYLRDNPSAAQRFTFDHVLVDEYQDLNRADQLTLDLLASQGTLTVVGDEDQSIYSFRFAHPEGIATFPLSHPGTHDEALVECQRSPKLVVDMANSLISCNVNRSSRVLAWRPSNPDGEVHVVQWGSMEEEAEGLAQFIHGRTSCGNLAAGKVLVLAPRRQIGYMIRDALNNLGTSAHSFFNEEALDGRPQAMNDCEAQRAFTLLSLLSAPEDIVSLRCWCGFGGGSLRAPAWQRLRAHCNDALVSPTAALDQLGKGEIHVPYTRDIMRRYSELQGRLAELEGLQGQALIDAIFPESAEWAAPFRLVSSVNDDGEDCSPSELFRAMRTRIIQPELPTDVPYVRVMSLHKSKGLTGDMVVVAGCVAGMIPAVIPPELSPPEQERFVEEQRRLFFVAITRTQQALVLSSFAWIRRDLAHRMRVPLSGGNQTQGCSAASMFMRQLGSNCPRTISGDVFLASR